MFSNEIHTIDQILAFDDVHIHQRLFDHYCALPEEGKQEFVLALIGRLLLEIKRNKLETK